jgi:hypothetical protein
MQTVHFENEDCRFYCPVTGVLIDPDKEQIESPALVFLVLDEVQEFIFLRDDLSAAWRRFSESEEHDELDWSESVEKWAESLPDHVVCFNISDGIAGGLLRIAIDFAYDSHS